MKGLLTKQEVLYFIENVVSYNEQEKEGFDKLCYLIDAVEDYIDYEEGGLPKDEWEEFIIEYMGDYIGDTFTYTSDAFSYIEYANGPDLSDLIAEGYTNIGHMACRVLEDVIYEKLIYPLFR